MQYGMHFQYTAVTPSTKVEILSVVVSVVLVLLDSDGVSSARMSCAV